MQKGFATLEIIFMTFIIAVLLSVAIPNAARMIDRVALDYEMKRLYSELRFLQSLERMTNMQDSHFSTTDDDPLLFIVYTQKYILQKNSAMKIYDEHYFSLGVTATQKGGRENWQIKFDDMGKVSPAISDSLELKSRLQKNSYIVFDSVGRFRGGRSYEKSE